MKDFWFGKLHKLYNLTIALKFAFAVFETIVGIALFFVHPIEIIAFLQKISAGELLEDPNSIVANTIVYLGQKLTTSVELFISMYLLANGLLKIFIIISLWKKKMWAYPVAKGIIFLFVIYEIFTYSRTHNPFWIFIIALDTLIIGLLFIEYRHMKEIHAIR